MSLPDRITSDPEICHGQAVVRGMRSGAMLGALTDAGMSFEKILATTPPWSGLIVLPSVRI
jgi:uncharacterized protein (DUF433 family)